MDAGLKLSAEDAKRFEENMLHGKKIKVMLFQLDADGNKIEFKFERDNNYDYEKLKDELPKDDGAIIIVDFEYKSKDGKTPRTLIAINYVPTSTPVKRRFKYPAALKGITNQYQIPVEMQPSDWSQMDTKALIEKVDK